MYNIKFSAHSFKGLDCEIQNANSKQSSLHHNDTQQKMVSRVTNSPLPQKQIGSHFPTKPKIKGAKAGGKSLQTGINNRGCSAYYNTLSLDQTAMAKESIYTFREVRTEGLSSCSKDRTYLFKEVKTPLHSSLTKPRNNVPVYLSQKGKLASYAQLPSSIDELSLYPKSRLTPRWASLSRSKGDIVYEFQGVKSTSDCASIGTKERVYTFKESKNSAQSSVASVGLNASQSEHFHETNSNVPYIQYFPPEFNTALISKEKNLNEFLPPNDLPTKTKNVADTAEIPGGNLEANKSSTPKVTEHLNDDLIPINETVSQSNNHEDMSEQVVSYESLTELSLSTQVSNSKEDAAPSCSDHGKSKKVFRDHFIDGILDCTSTLTTQREFELDFGEIGKEKEAHNSKTSKNYISDRATISHEPYSNKASLTTKTTEGALKLGSEKIPEIVFIGEKKCDNSKTSRNYISSVASLSDKPYSNKGSLITKMTEPELNSGKMAEITIIGEKQVNNNSTTSIIDVSKEESFSCKSPSHEVSLISITEQPQSEVKLNIHGSKKQKAKESLINFESNTVKLEDSFPIVISSPKSLSHCFEKSVESRVPENPVTPVKTIPKEFCPVSVVLKRSPVLEKYVAERSQKSHIPYYSNRIRSLNQTQSTDCQEKSTAKEEMSFFIKRDNLDFKTEPSTLEKEETFVRNSPALLFDVFGRVVIKEEPVDPSPTLQNWEYLDEDSSFSFEGFDEVSKSSLDLNLTRLFGSYSEVPPQTLQESRLHQEKSESSRKNKPKLKKRKMAARKSRLVKASEMFQQREIKKQIAKRPNEPKKRPAAIKLKIPSCCKSPQKHVGKKNGRNSLLKSKKDARLHLSGSMRNSLPEKTKSRKKLPKTSPSSEDAKNKVKIRQTKKSKAMPHKKAKRDSQGKKKPSNLSNILPSNPPSALQPLFTQPQVSLECHLCFKTYRLRKHLERHLKDHQNAIQHVTKRSHAKLASISKNSLSQESLKRSTMKKSKSRSKNVDTNLLDISKKKNDYLGEEPIPSLKNQQETNDLIKKSTKTFQTAIFSTERDIPAKCTEILSDSTTESAKIDQPSVLSPNRDGLPEDKSYHDLFQLGDPDQLSKINLDETEPDTSHTEPKDFFSDFIQDIDDSEFIFSACGIVQPKESVTGVASPLPLEDKNVSRPSFVQQMETVNNETSKNSLLECVLNPGEKTEEINAKIFSLVSDTETRETRPWGKEKSNQIENNSGVTSTKIAFSEVIPTLPTKTATDSNVSPLLENSLTDGRNLVQQAESLLHGRIPDCHVSDPSPQAFTNDKVTHESLPIISSVCHQTDSPFYSDDESDFELQLYSDHSSRAPVLKELDCEDHDLEFTPIVKNPSDHNASSIEKLEVFPVALVESKNLVGDHETKQLKFDDYGPELALVCHAEENKLNTLSTSLPRSNVHSEILSLSHIYTTSQMLINTPQSYPNVDTSKPLVCVAEVVNVPSTNSGLSISSQPVDIFMSPVPPNTPVLARIEALNEWPDTQKYEPALTQDHKTCCLSNSQVTTSKAFHFQNITKTLLPQTDDNSEVKPDNQGCSEMSRKTQQPPLNPVTARILVKPDPSETKKQAKSCKLKRKKPQTRAEEKSAAEILKYNTVQVLLERLSKR